MNKKNILKPFGIEVISHASGESLGSIPVPELKELIARHRFVVFRDFAPQTDEAMIEFCKTLGGIMEWEFGAVNELKVREKSANYLYTHSAVPFHWDGAFVQKIPQYIFFSCVEAPGQALGGETIFCDTPLLLSRLSQDQIDLWKKITITYKTEKIVHYGGVFTSPLIEAHPKTRELILRFAEPVLDLNPVELVIHHLPESEHEKFIEDVRKLLYSPDFCYAHQWKKGDIVIADNYTLLHGRNAFLNSAKRHLRRVNIL